MNRSSFLSIVTGVERETLDRAPDAMSQSAVWGLATLINSTIAGYTAPISTNVGMRPRSPVARCAAAVLLLIMGMALLSDGQTSDQTTVKAFVPQQTPIANSDAAQSQLSQQANLSTSPEAFPDIEVTYWLAEQEKTQADRIRIQDELNDLNRKMDALALNDLRDEINRNEAFIAEARRMRNEADHFVTQPIARSLDWVVKGAVDHASELRAELSAHLVELAPEQARLKRLMADAQDDLNSNNEMLKAVVCALEDARKARARQNKIEGLKALNKPQGSAGASTNNVGTSATTMSKP